MTRGTTAGAAKDTAHAGETVVVVGLARSGIAAARFLAQRGAAVVAAKQNW